jgi:hypothetical protein
MKDGPAPLEIKYAVIEERCYVICPDRQRTKAKKDAADREMAVSFLRNQVKQGDKS